MFEVVILKVIMMIYIDGQRARWIVSEVCEGDSRRSTKEQPQESTSRKEAVCLGRYAREKRGPTQRGTHCLQSRSERTQRRHQKTRSTQIFYFLRNKFFPTAFLSLILLFLSTLGCAWFEEQCHQGPAVRVGARVQGAQRLVAHLRGQAHTVWYTSRRDGLQATREHAGWFGTTAGQRHVWSCLCSELIIIIII